MPTATKVPEGGTKSPSSSSPQHSRVPSVRTPQVLEKLALTDVNVPDGGLAWPSSSLTPAGDGAVGAHTARVRAAGVAQTETPPPALAIDRSR